MFKLLKSIFLDEEGATLAVTYSFSANTLIVSSQVNANFDDVEAVVNALTSANYSNDSVLAAALGSDVVRSGYGLVQHTDGSLYVDVSDTNPCLEISDGGVRVKVDDSSIERASGGLQVKALGITDAMLAGSITAAKLAGSIPDSLLSQIATASKVNVSAITGTLGLANGGTGGATAAAAWANIGALGTLVSKSNDTSYLASTDGFVVAYLSGPGTLVIYSDSSNPPTTTVINMSDGYGAPGAGMFPVKKNNYYKVTGATAIHWIPIGN